jgi:type II secretory pathway pseudopilin PulG
VTASTQRLRLMLAVAVALVCMLGLMPTAAGASDTRVSRSNITINANALFDAAHGVRSGSGTADDPYVISGWQVSSITIKDTSAAVLITDNTISSTLVLDWIGGGITVVNNDIGDLRVNQNVPRTGEPTTGLIANNTFGVVGQLRHFDGVFEQNVVGTPKSGVDNLLGEWMVERAVNFDGFNGAHFRDNIIYGYVEVRLHGHHHSSGFGEDSHNHGGMDSMDHTVRYHEVWVTGNKITVPPGTFAALEYVDNNHAGNDRTAASETNKALNDPHVHHTQVHLTGNKLVGSGLSVNIFNADDERHIGTARGRLDIDNNTILLQESTTWPFSSPTGISVSQAKDLELYIRDNYIEGPHEHQAWDDYLYDGAGIDLNTIDAALIRVYDNMVMHRQYGISANNMPASTRWLIGGNLMEEVVEPVVWNSSVANKPEPRPAEEDDGTPPTHEEHQH